MKLKTWIVGSGRDGTTSTAHFLNDLFIEEGLGRAVKHEYFSILYYNALDSLITSGSDHALQQLRKKFAECPYDAVVGNGAAFVMPYLRDLLTPDISFIHLQRRDREACIRSWIKHAELHPDTNGYVSYHRIVCKRATAVHMGEMSQERWDALPLFDKFAWYYDKTHALLAEQSAWFSRHMHIYTEDLNDPVTLKAIADFVGVKPKKPLTPVHMNRFTPYVILRRKTIAAIRACDYSFKTSFEKRLHTQRSYNA